MVAVMVASSAWSKAGHRPEPDLDGHMTKR